VVANASGLSAGAADDGMMREAFWVPASFVVPAAIAWLASLRLRSLSRP
jgi:hypothetical protein